MKNPRNRRAAAPLLTLAVLGAAVPALTHAWSASEAPAGPVVVAPADRVAAPMAGPVVSAPAGSVRASLTLPATSLRAGASLVGTITVENDSGKPIQVLGCGSVYRVVLVRGSHHPAPSWPFCAREITLPTGVSTHPVEVTAAYHQCSPTGEKEMPACEQDGSMPPLPAGRYRAATSGVSPDLPVPAPLSVTVMP